MGYALLWIENLAFWLVLVALALAVVCQWNPSRRVRLVALGVAVAVPLGVLVLVTTMVGQLQFSNHVQTGLFGPMVGLTIGSLVGVVALLIAAFRTDSTTGRPNGWRWSQLRLALATAGVLLVHLMTFWNLDLAVRQQMVAVRAEAGSLALSVVPPRLPDRDNAALLYAQAFEAGLADRTPESYEKWLDGTSKQYDQFQPDDPDFVAYVKQRGPLLAIVREAARRTGCRFDRDWSRPSIDMLLPEMQNLRTAARDLQLEAHYRAAHGDLAGALEDVLALYRVADHAGEEPILVSLLVSFAIEGIATGNLEYILSAYPIGAEDLAVLDGWRPTPVSPRLQRALRMEEAFGLTTFCQFTDWRDLQAMLEVDAQARAWPLSQSAIYRVFLFAEDLRTYRQFMRTQQHLASLPFYQAHEPLKASDQSLTTTPMGVVTKLLAPALTAAHTAAARTEANSRLAQLAIALHRHRLQHGAFPATLDDFRSSNPTAFVPRDPFDGQPLKLVSTDDGLVLYSIGPDLKDDQGRPIDWRPPDPTAGDLTFRVKLAAPKPAAAEGDATQPK